MRRRSFSRGRSRYGRGTPRRAASRRRGRSRGYSRRGVGPMRIGYRV